MISWYVRVFFLIYFISRMNFPVKNKTFLDNSFLSFCSKRVETTLYTRNYSLLCNKHFLLVVHYAMKQGVISKTKCSSPGFYYPPLVNCKRPNVSCTGNIVLHLTIMLVRNSVCTWQNSPRFYRKMRREFPNGNFNVETPGIHRHQTDCLAAIRQTMENDRTTG